MITARAPDEMTMTVVDDVAAWEHDDGTLLYDPKFCFPPETLVALARAHARCPDLVYRESRRRHMGSDAAVAYVFGLGGVAAVGDSSGGRTRTTATTAEGSSGLEAEYSELDQESACYAAVEESAEHDYVLVGTAEEVECERRREANAEDMFVKAWNDYARSIERFLEEIDEETARTAARNNLVLVGRDTTDDFFDGFLEEEAAIEVGWNIKVPVPVPVPASEELFVNIDDEDAVPEWA